jgi:Flp pilus assembly protein TadG
MVEAAFAIPLFLVMVLGFVDIGFGVLQTSQATSAAADGARIGILGYSRADVSGSTQRTAIENAVKAKLVGQKVDTITVTCVNPAGTTVTCLLADPDVDRLKVTVSWKFVAISPVGKLLPNQNITGAATMGLVRQPIPPIVEEDTP